MKVQQRPSDSPDRVDGLLVSHENETTKDDRDGCVSLNATFNASCSSFSSSTTSSYLYSDPGFPQDDLLEFEEETFGPADVSPRRSTTNTMVLKHPPQSPRRQSLTAVGSHRAPRRGSASNSVAASFTSQTTARRSQITPRRIAARSPRTTPSSPSVVTVKVTSLNTASHPCEQRDMIRPKSDPRSHRRRSMEDLKNQVGTTSESTIAPLESPRKDSILNTPSIHGKRPLNRRKERHDRHVSKLVMPPPLWEDQTLTESTNEPPISPQRSDRRDGMSTKTKRSKTEEKRADDATYQRSKSAQVDLFSEFDIIAQRSKLKHVENPPSPKSNRISVSQITMQRSQLRPLNSSSLMHDVSRRMVSKRDILAQRSKLKETQRPVSPGSKRVSALLVKTQRSQLRHILAPEPCRRVSYRTLRDQRLKLKHCETEDKLVSPDEVFSFLSSIKQGKRSI